MKYSISSAQNPKIKHLLTLDKVRERRKHNQFTIEGIKELSIANAANYNIESVFYCEEIISRPEIDLLGINENKLISISKSVFEKIAYRESTGGVIAIAEQKLNHINQIKLNINPLLLIVEAVEKPGNLGAILRTADAAGIDAVIICDPQTDFYNPNVIRSSIGCVFSTQLASVNSEEAIVWLKKNKIKIFSTYLSGATHYADISYDQPCAIVMGSEAHGLSDIWIKNSDANILIPMRGKIDSMNVSVATAVVIFEAIRQRNQR